MASIVGLYYKTAGIETGGTNALTGLRTGGTLISSGDTEATPFSVGAVGTVYTLYFKEADGSTGADNGEESQDNFAPVLPPGLVGCFTYNGTFSATPTTGASRVTGAYQPLYVKQAASASNPTQWATGQSYATGARVYQSGAASTIYVCPTGQDHTSGTFATDLAAGKWIGENISTGTVVWIPGTLTQPTISITSVSGTTVTVTCAAAGIPPDSYHIERAAAADTSFASPTVVATADTDGVYADTVPDATLGYLYRVKTHKSGLSDSEYSATATLSVLTVIASANTYLYGGWDNGGGDEANFAAARADSREPESGFTLQTTNIRGATLKVSSTIYMGRGWASFDTSGLPDTCTIKESSLRLCCSSHGANAQTQYITDTDLTSAPSANSSSHNQSHYGGSSPTSRGIIASAATVDAYNSVAFTGTVSKTGNTYIGLRADGDVNNTPFTSSIDQNQWYGNAVSGKEPKLVIRYVA